MNQLPLSRLECLAAGLCGVIGVLMIGTSFAINTGPPLDADTAQLSAFASTHYRSVMWGAWLQAVGPMLIIIFALSLTHLARASSKLSGALVLFGSAVLVMVSLGEVTFYISALGSKPEAMGMISNAIGHAIQHLYFIVAAPALFLPLGSVLWNSRILPRAFSVLAFVLAIAFFALGVTSLYQLILSPAVTSLAGIQALWWMSAAITLILRAARMERAKDVTLA